MKLTLEPSKESSIDYPKIVIEAKEDYGTIDGVVEHLIRPALLAWGFTEQTVNEALGEPT